MDPEANRTEQLELSRLILESSDQAAKAEAAERLAELVVALDEWLTNGGAHPEEWQKA